MGFSWRLRINPKTINNVFLKNYDKYKIAVLGEGTSCVGASKSAVKLGDVNPQNFQMFGDLDATSLRMYRESEINTWREEKGDNIFIFKLFY